MPTWADIGAKRFLPVKKKIKSYANTKLDNKTLTVKQDVVKPKPVPRALSTKNEKSNFRSQREIVHEYGYENNEDLNEIKKIYKEKNGIYLRPYNEKFSKEKPSEKKQNIETMSHLSKFDSNKHSEENIVLRKTSTEGSSRQNQNISKSVNAKVEKQILENSRQNAGIDKNAGTKTIKQVLGNPNTEASEENPQINKASSPKQTDEIKTVYPDLNQVQNQTGKFENKNPANKNLKPVTENSMNQPVGLPSLENHDGADAEEEEQDYAPENHKIDMSPPNVIINDKKIIFNRVPVFDGQLWLFPIEEVATETRDVVTTDLVNKTITVTRFRDNSVVKVSLVTGIVTINNNPFKVLAGYQHIVLGSQVQLVPASAIAILLSLSLKNDNEKDYTFTSIITPLAQIQTTVQPQINKGLSKLRADYLNTTISVNDFRTADLLTKRFQLNTGAHNDQLALTSNIVFRGGTGGPFALFDTGNISYFNTNSESKAQFTLGDKTLGTLRSPFLSGVILRGISGQVGGKLPDSRIIYGAGFIPTNQRIQGKAESFLRYGRAVQVLEWTSSPKKKWQFSFGEAIYKDTIRNLLIGGKQTGGLLTGNVTRTGKYVDGESNLSFGFADDKRYEQVDTNSMILNPLSKPKNKSDLVNKNKNGAGVDLLIRIKPKEWFNFFGKTAYYAPGFYGLSSNSFYNDRNELTGGFNFNFSKVNFGASHTTGRLLLDKDKPDKYNIVNIFGNSTPFKKGPSFSANYSKNLSRVNPTLAFDSLILNPINNQNKITKSIDDVLVRRTTSVFRAGLMKNWSMTNFNASYNKIDLEKNTNVMIPQIGADLSDSFSTFDFNTNRTINNKFGINNFTQLGQKFNQAKLGIVVGPVFMNKLSFQTQYGALKPKGDKASGIFSLNLNYDFSKKGTFSLNYDKTDFLSQLFFLMKYSFIGDQLSGVPSVDQVIQMAKIKGRVIILDDITSMATDPNLAKGLPKVRVYFGNSTIVTDKNGAYEINNVSPGLHKVSIDFSDIPAYLATISNESVDLITEKGKETVYNFILAYYGTISGKLEVLGEKPEEIKETPPIDGIRVYLEGTDFEGLTNENGLFEIGDIKPGRYKLLIDPDYVPEEYEIINSTQIIEVRSKQKIQDVRLKIKYKERQIEQLQF